MLVAENRPRNLSWLHAGPLLFGDWGTSRLYVLGLAFYYTAHASLLYLAVMSLIMAGVAWGYTVVCRCFPEGGGVYSAARQINPLLSVIAATLLLCDFIVTAALSAVEGFHYFGIHSQAAVVGCAMGTMVALGVLNWLGARSAGRFALVIAIAAIAASAVVALLCIPLLPAGLRTFTTRVEGVESPWQKWECLVRLVLALSGVEAVASMTGLMKQPVARTAKRTIWPVLLEVVVLNVIFCIALGALPGRESTTTPDHVLYEQRMGLDSDLGPPSTGDTGPYEAQRARIDEVREYRQTAVKVLAQEAGSRALGNGAGRALAIVSGVVFGLLLLSAVNTAIMAMVSVFYALAQDGEMHRGLTKLNYSGVPWVGLLFACALPAGVLLFVHDDKALGELYAIGVVGAIAINMLCCAANRSLPVSRRERAGLWTLGVLMSAVEATIIVAKPHATFFAAGVIAFVLVGRMFVRAAARRAAAAEPLPVPAAGWMAEMREEPARLEGARGRIMLAVRGRDNAEFAVDLARKRRAALFAIYVRTLRILDVQPGQFPKLDSDPQAQEALGTAAVLAKRAGVPFVPIYVTSPGIAEEILDYTVTFNCDTLIMGKSRRTLLGRALSGDVLTTIQNTLPEGITLITRASPRSESDLRPVEQDTSDDDIASPS